MTQDWNAYNFVNAYHFVGDTLRDGQPVPADGVKLVHEGRLQMCWRGLHASPKAWQALEYAPGETLCRVLCGGEIIREDDKMVCSERTIVARIDATDLLRSYARQCALDVVHLWDAPDVVIEYLRTGDERWRVDVKEATSGAQRNRVMSAAREAAMATAACSLSATVRAAARDAATDAARAASEESAIAAARTRQRARLTRMVNAAFEVST